jgi:cytochrome P450
MIDFFEDTFYKDKSNIPKMCGVAFSKNLCLVVNRPEVAEELLLTKNKYYDKHDAFGDLVRKIAGDSIVFAKSDLKWLQRRKALSVSLYKDKLRMMIKMTKDVTIRDLRHNWHGQVDIVKVTANMFIQITLTCLFGEGYFDTKVTVRENGINKQMPLGETILTMMEKTMLRQFQPHLLFFPELTRYFFTAHDRELT